MLSLAARCFPARICISASFLRSRPTKKDDGPNKAEAPGLVRAARPGRVSGKLEGNPAPLQANAETNGATELPGDVATAHHAHHFVADLLVEHGPPRYQTEA